MPFWLGLLTAGASLATAVGVFVAAWQLALAKQQARTQFEDGLSAQYRAIIRRLPVEALLGESLDKATQQQALCDFYHYFDLSNEQAFLRKNRRVSKRTWEDWLEGIRQNLARPAFATAWAEVSRRAPESSQAQGVMTSTDTAYYLFVPHAGSLNSDAFLVTSTALVRISAGQVRWHARAAVKEVNFGSTFGPGRTGGGWLAIMVAGLPPDTFSTNLSPREVAQIGQALAGIAPRDTQ